tara:strand:+ start:1353 stop:1649 length:297 start_codon:yes stop_codon:yes gene_type:complete
MKLTSLLSERTESSRITIVGVSFRAFGHENRLYLLPETTKDLDLINDRGGKESFIQNETFPFLESVTGIKWQWDQNNPGAGLIFEVDLNAVIQSLKGA